MKKLVIVTLFVSLCAVAFAADEPAKESKAADRVQAAADVLNEIESAPDSGIPQEILGRADCVAVVPSMLKGGFVVGAKYGRGLASCRTPKGWSAPAFFTVTGGSFGFQIGVSSTDVVLLVFDGSERLMEQDSRVSEELRAMGFGANSRAMIVVVNKADRSPSEPLALRAKAWPDDPAGNIWTGGARCRGCVRGR